MLSTIGIEYKAIAGGDGVVTGLYRFFGVFRSGNNCMAATGDIAVNQQVGLVAQVVVILPAGKRTQPTTGAATVGRDNVVVAGVA